MAVQKSRKRAYASPRVVDYGTIEMMTGDCFGFCLDGENGGLYGFWPIP